MLESINIAPPPPHPPFFVFILHSLFSRVYSDEAPSDSHSEPAVPKLGVLSSVFEKDEAHSWAVVGECVRYLSSSTGAEFVGSPQWEGNHPDDEEEEKAYVHNMA